MQIEFNVFAYALAQLSRMEIWLNDGRMEIDNNLVETAARQHSPIKKEWLFFGDASAGQRSVIFHTIIEICRREEIDRYAYLCDVLSRLPKMIDQLIGKVPFRTWANAKTGQIALTAAACIHNRLSLAVRAAAYAR